jgi:hypothetical protein
MTRGAKRISYVGIRWTGQRETTSSIHYQLFFFSSRVPALEDSVYGRLNSTDLQTDVVGLPLANSNLIQSCAYVPWKTDVFLSYIHV